MTIEFTVSEIREAVALARIYSADYTEEQFRAATELVKRVGEPDYLETVTTIDKFEKEKGIHFTEALDACKKLLKDKTTLEQNLSKLKAEVEAVQGELSRAREILHQTEDTTKQAEAGRDKAETELNTFREKANCERERIGKELEEYRERADVSKREVDMANQLRAELNNQGVALELVLDLAHEFAGYGDSRGELAKRLEQYGKLSESIRSLEAELDRLRSYQAEEQDKTNKLEYERTQLTNTVSQLQADAVHEEELRRFYHRYQVFGPLMDNLSSWHQIYFVRCNNPSLIITGAFSRSMGPAHFWVDKPPVRCPHCGGGANLLAYDEGLYRAIGMPVGTPVKLQLGE